MHLSSCEINLPCTEFAGGKKKKKEHFSNAVFFKIAIRRLCLAAVINNLSLETKMMVKISLKHDPLKFTGCKVQCRHRMGILKQRLLISCVLFMLM